ncbi:MAG: glycoside hydrolase N-terminal domain-containing protein [Planctomycetota bacterium]
MLKRMMTSELHKGICLAICLSFVITVVTNFAFASETSSGRWVIRSQKPASEWEHGIVTGNGRHGARVMGKTDNERITMNHEELFVRFWDRKKEMVADIARLLPEVRRLIDEGKEKEAYTLANDEATKQLLEKGRAFRKAIIPHPAFDLHIEHQSPESPTDYRRQLDMETGEVLVRWRNAGGGVEQRVFSSRPHNVNVIQLKRIDGRKLDVTLCLKETPGRSQSIEGLQRKDFLKSVKTRAIPGWLIYDADYGFDPGGYQGVARVTSKGGTMSIDGDQMAISGADEILVLIRIVAQKDGSASQHDAMQAELTKMPFDYQALLAPHAKVHGEMFRRVILDMGSAKEWTTTSTEKLLDISKEEGVTPLFLEQIYAMGRYLLISSSGRYPPPLQGIWAGNWSPPWEGGFVLDSNVNLAVSAASMGNLPECAQSYFNYVRGMLPGWRLNARKYLGCRGFLAGNYTDPETGYLVHLGRTMGWMYWPGGAGWNLHPIYDYALFTGDSEFMKNEVLPLYLEMADFYEDYMVMSEDGFYHIYPGISPENRPKGQVKTLKDCTFDLAVAREVFRILIELGEQFDLDKEKIAKWKNYRQKIFPYRINEDGTLAEWAPEKYGEYYNHRHISHLIQVYPWWECKLPGADPAYTKAAGVALDKRFQFDANETHGLMHVALMAARLQDVEKIRTNLHRLATRAYFYTNMATSCRKNQRIANLDASLSLPRLLMEMLVFSRPGHIELLPAWPAEYPDGSIRGVLVRGGHKLDLTWAHGNLVSATLHAGRNDSGTIIFSDNNRSFEFEAGESYRFDSELQMEQEKL